MRFMLVVSPSQMLIAFFLSFRNLKFRKHQKLHSEKLQRIQMALDASMQRHMENPKLNLNGIHTVTKAFNYRNSKPTCCQSHVMNGSN